MYPQQNQDPYPYRGRLRVSNSPFPILTHPTAARAVDLRTLLVFDTGMIVFVAPTVFTIAHIVVLARVSTKSRCFSGFRWCCILSEGVLGAGLGLLKVGLWL